MSAQMDTVLVQYVFLDVIEFTREDRTVEDMVSIIGTMNQVVRLALNEQGLDVDDVILLPTGDGMCIAIMNQGARNTHMEIAEAIRAFVAHYNRQKVGSPCAFDLHIAVDEGKDTLIQDITGRRNLIGAGINRAARLMSTCNAGEIVISSVIYENISRLAKYKGLYSPRKASVKNGAELQSYFHRNIEEPNLGDMMRTLIGALSYVQGEKLTEGDVAALEQGAKLIHGIYGLGSIEWIKHRTAHSREARISFGSRRVEVVLKAGMDLYFKALPKETPKQSRR